MRVKILSSKFFKKVLIGGKCDKLFLSAMAYSVFKRRHEFHNLTFGDFQCLVLGTDTPFSAITHCLVGGK